jgi:Ca2+-binding EF-hand superfamily protein
MKKTILTLSIFTLLLSSSPVQATKNVQTRGKKMVRSEGNKEIRAARVQKTSEELEAIKQERINILFEKLDVNKDGKLSKEELAAMPKVRQEIQKERREKRAQFMEEAKKARKEAVSSDGEVKKNKRAGLKNKDANFRGKKANFKGEKPSFEGKRDAKMRFGERFKGTKGHCDGTGPCADEVKQANKKNLDKETLEKMRLNREKNMQERFAALDKNNDSFLDKEEWMASRETMFQKQGEKKTSKFKKSEVRDSKKRGDKSSKRPVSIRNMRK